MQVTKTSALLKLRELEKRVRIIRGGSSAGKTIGIIGYGRLGKMMKKYCEAFGMITIIDDPYEGYNNLDLLKSESDIISLHVHANEETRHMIDKKFLDCMKKNSYIINTSRGEIVNENDIIQSLKENQLKEMGFLILKKLLQKSLMQQLKPLLKQ